MGLHNDYVAKFRDQADRLKQNGPIDITDEKTCDQERMLLFSAIIKCADIGNVVSKMGNNMRMCVIPVLFIFIYSVLVTTFQAWIALGRSTGGRIL